MGEVLPGGPRAARLARLVPLQPQQDTEWRRELVILLGHYSIQLLPVSRQHITQRTELTNKSILYIYTHNKTVFHIQYIVYGVIPL